jgi:hypothetical protein
MDRVFRAMRNPERARGTGKMAPTSTSVDGLETVETRNHKISRAPQARHRCAGGRANCGQLRWTVAPRADPSDEHRSVQRLLRLARASRAYCSGLAKSAEPPDADPHVRSCGRGGRATVSPIPIWNALGHCLPASKLLNLNMLQKTFSSSTDKSKNYEAIVTIL